LEDKIKYSWTQISSGESWIREWPVMSDYGHQQCCANSEYLWIKELDGRGGAEDMTMGYIQKMLASSKYLLFLQRTLNCRYYHHLFIEDKK
jgi:hypothetical protein